MGRGSRSQRIGFLVQLLPNDPPWLLRLLTATVACWSVVRWLGSWWSLCPSHTVHSSFHSHLIQVVTRNEEPLEQRRVADEVSGKGTE